jgi:hypothetical protein
VNSEQKPASGAWPTIGPEMFGTVGDLTVQWSIPVQLGAASERIKAALDAAGIEPTAENAAALLTMATQQMQALQAEHNPAFLGSVPPECDGDCEHCPEFIRSVPHESAPLKAN